MTKLVVIVEDEPAIRRGVADALRFNGYAVGEAGDGDAGLTAALGRGVDLVLLDLLLPKRDGLDVLAQVRRLRPTLPVIVLTARGTEEDRVRGLKLGADDYVVKPFSARELLARVEAVLRRAPHREEHAAATLGPVGIDLQRREAAAGATRAELSETEVAVLGYLLTHRARAVGRDELLTWVWGVDASGGETRAVDMVVARLRAKLRDLGGDAVPEAVLTVRNKGYMAGPELRPAGGA